MFWAREHHGNGRTEVECYFCVFFSSSPAWRFRIVVWNPELMLPGMFVLPIIPLDHIVGFAQFQHLLPRAAIIRFSRACVWLDTKSSFIPFRRGHQLRIPIT